MNYDDLNDADKAEVQLRLAAHVNAVHAGEGDVDETKYRLKELLVDLGVAPTGLFYISLDAVQVESAVRPGVWNAAHCLFVHDEIGGREIAAIVLEE